MTFLAPGFFYAALGVAAAVVALHFIVTRQPRAGVLPTARFVPDFPATATARATRPSDLLLMLLRILVVLAAGAALARPVLKPSRGADARVILVDVSRASRNTAALRDSARSAYREHDALVLFDSSARLLGGNVVDSLSRIAGSPGRGNMSAALIAAIRAGSALRERADSVELVIVSSFDAEEIDAATDSIRKLWPGRAQLIRLAGSVDSAARSSAPLELKTDAGDPLHVTVGRARREANAGSIIVRSSGSEADSRLVSAEGRALIDWPIMNRPRGTIARATRDTTGGVVAGSALVVAGFERRWMFPADSLRGATVVARWVDGEPAAAEWPAGRGCVRSVSLPVPGTGDLVIRDDFVRFVAAISGVCAGSSVTPAPGTTMATLAGAGGMAPRESFAPRDDVRSILAPWLFALTIAAALAELVVRRSVPWGSGRASSRPVMAESAS